MGFFFFHWHYSPLWALACPTISFHFFLSATNSLHLLTPSTWRSLSSSSFHLFLGLPILLVPSISWVKRVFCISYKMILRLHTRMDRVLNLLNVSRFQWRCWWGACYASLSYPAAEYRHNKKEFENPSPRSFFLTFQFSHSSDILQQCDKARVSPIWPLLASTHYFASWTGEGGVWGLGEETGGKETTGET